MGVDGCVWLESALDDFAFHQDSQIRIVSQSASFYLWVYLTINC